MVCGWFPWSLSFPSLNLVKTGRVTAIPSKTLVITGIKCGKALINVTHHLITPTCLFPSRAANELDATCCVTPAGIFYCPEAFIVPAGRERT